METPRRPGMLVQGIRFLSPREAMDVLREGALLVDLRMDLLVAMKAFEVPEQVLIPHRALRERSGELPRDRTLLLADATGVYLRESAKLLAELGFGEVLCLNGGILAWEEAGLPLATDPEALLNGQCPCTMRSRKDGKG